MVGDMLLAARQVVAQQQVKHFSRALCILRRYLDETARLGVHRRQPHHLCVVFAKALGTLDGILCTADAFQKFSLFRFGISKVRLALALDLIQGRFRDIHIAFLDE